MTVEEQIKQLEEMKRYLPTRTQEEQAEVDREAAEIDTIIASYDEQIAALEAKINNEDNYKYSSPNSENRDFSEELLEESFERQLEELDKSDREYKELQEIGTHIFASWEDDIRTLNVEIEDIERRLRKNDYAVSKGLKNVMLTPEALEDLNLELESKKQKLAFCQEQSNLYVTDLKDYGEELTANNRKRQALLKKKEKLAELKESRAKNAQTVDKYKLRLDQDELARLKAGVEALKNRKEAITYDHRAKIDKMIEELKNNKDVVQERDYEEDLLTPNELDEERKAEVEDSDIELLEKKQNEGIRAWLKKHKKKFIAAGLALLLVLSAKSCSDLKEAQNKPDETLNSKHSYSQNYDEEKDKEDEETPEIENGGMEEENPGLDTEPDPEPTPDIEPEPQPEPTPDIEPDLEPEPTPEKDNTVELNEGEKIGGLGDILNGGEGISYGDELGKTTSDGLEVVGHESGKTIVELPAENTNTANGDASVEQMPTQEELHKSLEEFFGGPISITDYDNAYENGETMGRTR